jgi:N-methylhydantoinase A
VPGPVCYGLGGTEATLTDANVCLGYLHPERLPSGLTLHADKARRAVAEQVGAPLGLELLEAAHGVYLLGCAGMARAVRAVTIERGRDPQEFTLIAFGGNGPLFAAEMARSLEIATVLVPPAPGVWSALGLLEAEMEHHLVRTFLRPLAGLEPRDLVEALASLEREAESLLSAQGYGADRLEIERSADLKYQGQSFELAVPLGPAAIGIDAISRLAEAFDKEHERTYGHKAEGDPIQIVNLRLTARVRRTTDMRRETRFIPGERARGGEREAYFGPGHGVIRTPVIGREDLGDRPRPGPLLIDEYDATTLVPPDGQAHLDTYGNIVMATGA